MKLSETLIKLEKNYKQLFYIGLVSGILFFISGIGFLGYSSKQVGKYTEMKNGAQICTARIAKSVLALQSNSLSSLYLRPEYLDSTEECFSQLRTFEASNILLADNNDGVTSLIDKAFLANQRIIYLRNQPVNSVKNTSYEDLLRRVHSLDLVQYELVNKLNQDVNSLSWMRLLSEVLIFLSFMSMSVLLFFFYLYKRRYHDQVGKITSELKNYVSDFHGNLGQIESNFLRFFEKMNLNDQKVAFDQYQQYWRSYYFEQLKNDQQFENQSLKNDYMTADEMSTVQDLIKDKDVESIISQEKEKINATGSINEIDFGDIKKVDFEDQTFDIIKFDIWAKKFLASPVIMELKERIAITNSLSKNKNILINIEEDGLNLIIYHVFLKIAEKYQQMDLEKDQSKVEVKSSFSKNILKLSFKIDNLIFNPDELEYFSENKNQDNLDLNFEVISDFLQKFGLMINLKNKINSQEQNCEINISFPCMKTPRSLSHLVKGKKKHIIQEMKKQSEQRL